MDKDGVIRIVQAARKILEAGKVLASMTRFSTIPIIGQDSQQNEKKNRPDNIGIAVLYHFNYSLELLDMIIITCEQHRDYVAGILLRSMFEITYRGAWIVRPDSEKRAESFFKYHHKSTMANRAIHAPIIGDTRYWGEKDSNNKIQKEINNEFRKNSYCSNFRDILCDMGEEKSYETHFRLLSGNTHGRGYQPSPVWDTRMSWLFTVEATRRFVVIARAMSEVNDIPKKTFKAIFHDAEQAIENQCIWIANEKKLDWSRDADGNVVIEVPSQG